MSIAKWLLAKKLGGGSPFPPVIKRVTGNPIEFTDGADAPLVKCVTQITGSQDLHGYDKPWVGGAGKNKLPLPTAQTVNGVTLTHNSDGSLTLTGTASANIYFDFFEGNFDSTAFAGYVFRANSTYTSWASSTILFRISTSSRTSVQQTYGNADMTISDNGSGLYFAIRVGSGYEIPSGGVTIYPMLRASDTTDNFAPYSNICPITAYTEGEIEVRGGENLVYKKISGVGIQPDGTPYSNSTFNLFVAQVESGKSYYFDTNETDKVYAFFNSEPTIGSVAYGNTRYVKSDPRFTAPITGYVAFRSTSAYNDGALYAEETHTTTYPSAIYRGSENVVNGSVETEHGFISFDGTESWADLGGYSNQFAIDITDIISIKIDGSGYALPSDTFTNMYEVATVNAASRQNGQLTIYKNNSQRTILALKDTRFATLADFINSLGSVNLQLAYKLATPTTESITPTNLPIKSLSGYNHIESSTGDMTIDYITEGYQNFVDTVESALPNTRKGGVKAFDIFATLDNPSTDPEPDKDSDEGDKKVKEETKDDMR